MVIVPETTVPASGEVMDTEGCGAGCDTTTLTLLEVAVCPDLSVALATKTCAPLLAVVVSQDVA